MVRVHPCLPRSSQSPNESGHRHASGWLDSQRAAGTPVRDVAEGISPNLAKAALAGVVDGKLVDLTYPLERDAAVRIVTDKSPEALPLLPPQHGASAGGGRDQPVPRRAVRHRSGDRRRLLLRLRRPASVRARGSRGDRSEDEGARRRRISSTSGRCGRARRRRRSSRSAASRSRCSSSTRRPRARRTSPSTRSRTRTPSSTSASARTCRPPAS